MKKQDEHSVILFYFKRTAFFIPDPAHFLSNSNQLGKTFGKD